jgi:4-amino-4-deoxy-L-arabinose transferase-like glycosyltransferase
MRFSSIRFSTIQIILLFGFVIRTISLFHGLSFHPDERHMVNVTSSLSLKDMNPHSFAYGSLPFYLVWIAANIIGVVFPSLNTYDGIYLVGRASCIVTGTIGIWLVYLIAKEIFDDQISPLLTALLLATNPLHIQLSHFFTSDVILTSLLEATFLFIIKFGVTKNTKFFYLASLFFGMSMATKITAIFLLPVLSLTIMHFFYVQFTAKKWQILPQIMILIMLSSMISMITFILIEPYAILDFKTFVANTKEQTDMVRGIWRPPYAIQYAGTISYLYPIQQMFFYTITPPFALLAIIGLSSSIIKREKEFYLITFFVLFFFAIVGQYWMKYPRYMLPVFPYIMILITAGVAHILKYFKTDNPQYPNT